MSVSRRDFVKAAAAAGAGLTLAISFQGCGDGAPEAAPGELVPNAFVRVAPDGTVTVVVGRSEMGQGVSTGLAMILAEELDADWSRVATEAAPLGRAFRNTLFWNLQVTGISTSVRDAWRPMREAGARARAMLLAAAASRWGVTVASCRTEAGVVHHDASGRSAGYGALAGEAAELPVPRSVRLKEPAEFRIIGRRLDRLDAEAKVRGTAVYGLDVRLPHLAIASVERCPVVGGRVASVPGEGAARAMPGVLAVVRLEDRVAVVAESYWQAATARRALGVTWEGGDAPDLDTAAISAELARLLAGKDAVVVRRAGDVDSELAKATRTVTARYDLPYLAHLTMEPQNCTAWVHDGTVEVWAPTQFQAGPFYAAEGGARGVAAAGAGVSTSDVILHTTLIGGGFGRRLEVDYVGEAARIAREVDRPVQVVWSREDDLQHDYYRPVAAHELAGALGADGLPSAWRHRVATPSVSRHWVPWIPNWALGLGGIFDHGGDYFSLEGALDPPYAVPARLVDWRELKVPIRIGFWRSVGHAHTIFAVESFIDELAAAAGRDPLEYRRALAAGEPRVQRVLDAVAARAGWDTPRAPGRALGVAVFRGYESVIAQVAEVGLDEKGGLRVHRVTCVADCGTVINPGLVEAQLEGGIAFGLSAALYGEVTFARGRAQQQNFYDAPILRLPEMPSVEVHLLPSAEPPGGVGELPVPPVAPAVANALFALTGERVRRLPIRLSKG